MRSEPDLDPVVQDQTVRPAPAGLVPAPHHARYRLSWPNPRRSPADEDGLGPGLAVSAVASSTLLPRTSISLASMALILAAGGKPFVAAPIPGRSGGGRRWLLWGLSRRTSAALLAVIVDADIRRGAVRQRCWGSRNGTNRKGGRNVSPPSRPQVSGAPLAAPFVSSSLFQLAPVVLRGFGLSYLDVLAARNLPE